MTINTIKQAIIDTGILHVSTLDALYPILKELADIIDNLEKDFNTEKVNQGFFLNSKPYFKESFLKMQLIVEKSTMIKGTDSRIKLTNSLAHIVSTCEAVINMEDNVMIDRIADVVFELKQITSNHYIKEVLDILSII